MIMFPVIAEFWKHSSITTTKSIRARDTSSQIIGEVVKKTTGESNDLNHFI